MSLNQTLESERLTYKPLDTSYCTAQYLSWLNDQEVTRYLEIFAPYSEGQLKTYLEESTKNESLLFWAIHIRTNNKHIGNIKIDPINKYHGFGEYGIMMGDREQWGKGYGKEASKRIIEYCFNDFGLRKITLGVVKDNIPAVKLYENLGFVTEGIYRKHGFYDGQYRDVLRMAVFNPSAT